VRITKDPAFLKAKEKLAHWTSELEWAARQFAIEATGTACRTTHGKLLPPDYWKGELRFAAHKFAQAKAQVEAIKRAARKKR
jgi:hypothetical protein